MANSSKTGVQHSMERRVYYIKQPPSLASGYTSQHRRSSFVSVLFICSVCKTACSGYSRRATVAMQANAWDDLNASVLLSSNLQCLSVQAPVPDINRSICQRKWPCPLLLKPLD